MKFFFGKGNKKKADTGNNYRFLWMVMALSVFGLIAVYDASTVEALRDFGDPYYYLKNQALWLAVGWLALLAMWLVNLKWLQKLALPLFGFSLLLLVMVLIPGLGLELKGAKRWLNLGFFVVQPTELLKLSLILYLSHWLSKPKKMIFFLVLVAVVLGLVMLQPDMGTALVIMATAFLLYYFSGASLLRLALLTAAGVALGLVLIMTSSYRRERLMTFLKPDLDPMGSSYHIQQALLAIGSGGLKGIGFGQSRQKYHYLPEAATDSIFAVVAEETGFVGAGSLVLAFAWLTKQGFDIAQKAQDSFARLASAGIASWFGVQTFINLGAMVALLPLTGIPLPLFSYGGSSLVVTLAGLGVLARAAKESQ